MHGAYHCQTGTNKSIVFCSTTPTTTRYFGPCCLWRPLPSRETRSVAHPQCTPRAHIPGTSATVQQLLCIEARDGIKKRKWLTSLRYHYGRSREYNAGRFWRSGCHTDRPHPARFYYYITPYGARCPKARISKEDDALAQAARCPKTSTSMP